MFYLVGLLVATTADSDITGEFLARLGIGSAFLLLTFFFHSIAGWADRDSGWGFVVEHLVLLAAAVGFMFAASAIPYRFAAKRIEPSEDEESVHHSPEDEKARKSETRFDRIVAMLISILALLTALLQFLDSMGE